MWMNQSPFINHQDYTEYKERLTEHLNNVTKTQKNKQQQS